MTMEYTAGINAIENEGVRTLVRLGFKQGKNVSFAAIAMRIGGTKNIEEVFEVMEEISDEIDALPE